MKAASLPDSEEVVRLYKSVGGLVPVSRLLHANQRRIRRVLLAEGLEVGPRGKRLREYRCSAETRARMSVALKGKPKSPEARENIGRGRKGLKLSDETKHKLSQYAAKRVGNRNPNWRGGVTKPNEQARKTKAYGEWRSLVFLRDNFTCKVCGQRGGRLHVDHLKPFSTHPELRLEISNGRTLCYRCHLATPTYAGRLQQRRH